MGVQNVLLIIKLWECASLEMPHLKIALHYMDMLSIFIQNLQIKTVMISLYVTWCGELTQILRSPTRMPMKCITLMINFYFVKSLTCSFIDKRGIFIEFRCTGLPVVDNSKYTAHNSCYSLIPHIVRIRSHNVHIRNTQYTLQAILLDKI